MTYLFFRPFTSPVVSLLVVFLSVLTGPQIACASEDVFYGALLREEIKPNESFYVADTNNQSITYWKSVRDVIWFSIDEEYFVKDAPFTATLHVQIEKWDIYGNPMPSEEITFRVHYESDEGARFAFTDKYEFTNASRLRITVLEPGIDCSTCSSTDFFRLEAKIIVDKDFLFDCSEPADFQAVAVDTTSNSVIFGWNKIPGAEEYDFEWTFYDALDQLPIGNDPETDFDLLFRNNATRVTVPFTTYAVPLVYPAGTLFVRLRPVQYAGDYRYEGRWSSLKSAPLPISNYPANEKFVIDNARWHEKNLNWQTQLVFAEEGKKSHSVQYFDGALYSRQQAVRSDATNIVTISETVYDAQGRPAAQIMPAPVSYTAFGQGDIWLGRLRYLPKFVADPGGGIYDKNDFFITTCSAGLEAPAVSNSASAVGRYYSDFNPKRDDYMHRYIPDAEGWPFAVTEYTPDKTGRIKRQGGLGAEFRMGSGHETRFFYAKPDQNELDRLFGNEVGVFSHYQKNMVIDPHGQASVSYVDAHGRTVATALAGPKPDNLQSLYDHPLENTPIVKNLLDNALEGSALVTTTTLMVTSTDEAGDFYYALSPLSDTTDICVDGARCYDCLYDLEIAIQDDCGQHYTPDGVPFHLSNYTLGQLDTECENLASGMEASIISGTLTPGTYQVTKTLSVSQDALQYYLEDYIEHLTCLPPLESIIQTLSDPPNCDFSCEDCIEQVGSQEDFVYSYLSVFKQVTQEDTQRAIELYHEAIAACQEFCKDDNDCDILYAAIVGDLTPGGQYALYGTTANGFVDTTDQASIFFDDPVKGYAYQHPAFQGDINQVYYVNENGNPDTVEIGGVKMLPQNLSIDDFIRYWKPSWALSLLTHHPEYCYYECCLQQVSIHDYDVRLEKINTYQEALEYGFLPASGLLNNDPLFQVNTGPYLIMKELLFYEYSNAGFPDCGPHLGLVQIIQSAIYCDGAVPCTDTIGCDADNDMFWIALRTAYLTLRRHYKYLELENCVRSDPDSHCKTAEELCFGDASCPDQPSPNPYQFKVARVLKVDLPPANVEVAIGDLLQQAQAGMQEHCSEACHINVGLWMDTLQAHCTLVQNATSTQINYLQNRLYYLCMAGCDGSHPLGSMTTNGTPSEYYGDLTIQDALEAVFGPLNPCDNGCTQYVISYPGTYTAPQYLAPRVINTQADDCICHHLEELEQCYGSEQLLGYLNLLSNQQLTQEELDALIASCDGECLYLPFEIAIPPYLECDVCKDYGTVYHAYIAASSCVSNPIDPAEEHYIETAMNHLLGLNLKYANYYRFLFGPAPSECARLCPEVLFPVTFPDSCLNTFAERDTVLAKLMLQNMLDSLRKGFIDHYLSKCLGPQVHEIFTYTTEQSEYHYTLYFYDQANNLVKTIPPAGVHPLDDSQVLEVQAHRNDPVNSPTPVYPDHTLVTRYWFNTLNQVVRDSTPDRDITHYWYDQLGRLTFSQTKRQAEEDRFSYLLYEPLGRVKESGVVTIDNPLAHPLIGYPFPVDSLWLANNGSEWQEITRTFYDDVMDAANTDIADQFGGQGQENLRNRISTLTYRQSKAATPADYGDKSVYDFASHFSYDIAGNVKTLVQEIRPLEDLGHRFKKIEYEYDLVSGKTNKVYYQRGAEDQFVHHYVYDVDNRLQYVETSTNDALWERDAQNEYYLHGPLYRTELGERRVQGVDYAYTLQGWIKGMNASTLQPGRDMGRDGDPNSAGTPGFIRNQTVARDAAAYTLGYFNQDYVHIGLQSSDGFELDHSAFPGFDNIAPSLYNGNISNAVYGVRKLKDYSGEPLSDGYGYQYDQLNRLKSQTNLSDYEPNSYTWNGNIDLQYQTFAKYDGNGNITSLHREGDNGPMDMLEYEYGDPDRQNRLTRIRDDADPNLYTNDLDDQPGPVNYFYDLTGNIVQDNAQFMTATWTYADKLRSVDIDNSPDNNVLITFSYDAMGNRVVKEALNREPDPQLPDLNHIITTYYIRDASGNVLATYKRYASKVYGQTPNTDSLTLEELHIYGSKRLGILQPKMRLWPLEQEEEYPLYHNAARQSLFEGWKYYELTNHLGNVLAVVTDRKRAFPMGAGPGIEWFEPDVVSAQQYYPFGMIMPGREYVLDDYRYGFNGKENDNDIKGRGNQQDYGMRIYDPRVGRFLSVDPIAREYPFLTSYQFASNRPIDGVDQDGLEYLRSDESHVEVIDGEVRLKVENFNRISRNNWNNWQNDPNNWSVNCPYPNGCIGLSRRIANIEIIEPVHARNDIKDGASMDNTLSPAPDVTNDITRQKLENTRTKNDGKTPDNRFKGNKINNSGGVLTGSPGATKVAARGALVINVLILVNEWAQSYATGDTRTSVNKHLESLKNAVENVNTAIKKDWIPPEYLNNKSISEIINFVLMGQESSDSKINELGKKITLEISQNYRPPIILMPTDSGMDNYPGQILRMPELKPNKEDEKN